MQWKLLCLFLVLALTVACSIARVDTIPLSEHVEIRFPSPEDEIRVNTPQGWGYLASVKSDFGSPVHYYANGERTALFGVWADELSGGKGVHDIIQRGSQDMVLPIHINQEEFYCTTIIGKCRLYRNFYKSLPSSRGGRIFVLQYVTNLAAQGQECSDWGSVERLTEEQRAIVGEFVIEADSRILGQTMY
jgi:hypothetical protein